MRNRELEDVAANLLRNTARIFVGRAVEDEHELLAAVARREIERPLRTARDALRDALERVVAGLMAVKVVVDLEEIDVDENDRDTGALAPRLPPEALDVIVEDAAVIEPCHAVTQIGRASCRERLSVVLGAVLRRTKTEP